MAEHEVIPPAAAEPTHQAAAVTLHENGIDADESVVRGLLREQHPEWAAREGGLSWYHGEWLAGFRPVGQRILRRLPVDPGLDLDLDPGFRQDGCAARPLSVRYEAIGTALGAVADRALELGASVQMPRIGCGPAGGKWSRIEPLLEQRLLSRGVEVTVYDFD